MQKVHILPQQKPGQLATAKVNFAGSVKNVLD